MRRPTPWILLSSLALLAACSEQPPAGPDALALSAVPVVDQPIIVVPTLESEPVTAAALPQLEPLRGGPEAPPSFEALIDLEVRHGETLVVLADQAGLTAEDLAAVNGFDVTHPLRAGERILVPVDRVDADTLQGRRDDSRARRLDRYLRGRGGVAGVSTHRVRTGETGWSIARDVVDVPLWVLAAYNPEIDLDRLGIGDSLQVPVLNDLVAELEPALLEVATERPDELEAPARPGLDLEALARDLEEAAELP